MPRTARLLAPLLTVLAIVTLAGCGDALPNAPNGPPERDPLLVRKTPAGDGCLERRQGVLVLTTRGTPRDEGYQHGMLLREEIRAFYREYYQAKLFASGWLSGEGFSTWYARALARSYTREERAELAGVAEGADVPEDWILTLQANPVWQTPRSWFGGAQAALPAFGSSAFAVAGGATVGGATLLGSNVSGMDFNVRHRYGVIQVHHPSQGPAFVTVGVPGRVLDASLGWSQAGVAIAATDVPLAWQNASGVTGGLLTRRIMQRCRTLDEVERCVRDVPHRAGQGLVLLAADRHGRARRFEIAQTLSEAWHGQSRIATGEIDQAHPWLAAGTTYPTLPGVPRPDGASAARLARLEQALAGSQGRIDSSRAMEILVSPEGAADQALSLRQGPGAWRLAWLKLASWEAITTFQSAVVQLDSDRLYLAIGREQIESPAQFVAISLAELVAATASVPTPPLPVATASARPAPQPRP